MKFLIVEDNTNMRKVIGEIITRCGDNIYECSDGTEALEAYQKFQPDWVLMDIKMEFMDGLTATKIIMKKYPEAKVIIVSNFNDQYLKANAAKAGAIAYIEKDRLIELNNIINRSEVYAK